MPSQMVKATMAATALASASNVLAQILEAYRDKQPLAFDIAKFLRFVILALITAPPNYHWQQLLERTFPAYQRREPAANADVEKQELGLGLGDDIDAGREKEGDEYVRRQQEQEQEQPKPRLNLRNTMTKWFVDCITLGAIFNTVAFFIIMGLLKRQPFAQIGDNIRTETIPVIVAGYKIWPFASIISFSCVPVEKRIVFLNFVGLIWGIYMSLVAART